MSYSTSKPRNRATLQSDQDADGTAHETWRSSVSFQQPGLSYGGFPSIASGKKRSGKTPEGELALQWRPLQPARSWHGGIKPLMDGNRRAKQASEGSDHQVASLIRQHVETPEQRILADALVIVPARRVLERR